MAYEYEISEEAAEEIDQAIRYYDKQFSSGAADFLSAYDATISSILQMPESGRRRSPKDPDIRGKELKGEANSLAYAKRFPYLLLYKIYEKKQLIIIYQLWHIKSGQGVREGP